MMAAPSSLPPPGDAGPRAHPGAHPGVGLVPIRGLGIDDRAALLEHFLALQAEDRYLRFGYPATDRQVERYVAGIDFVRDELFGVFDRRLRLVAVAHLAMGEAQGGQAEFGVSVLSAGRGRGIGTRLFERAAMFARNRGLHSLRLQCLSENAAMMGIARRAGMHVHNCGGETEAILEIPPRSLLSHLDEWLRDAAAEFDFAIKLGLHRPQGPAAD